MAERITVKSTSIKRGTNDKGDWVNTRITATNGAKWGGFDRGLSSLQEGDVIDITESEQKGQNLNILKWNKVESAEAAVPGSPGNGKTSKSPEQFDADRRSIESQTAFNGIVRLIDQEAVQKTDIVPSDLKDLAYNWARVRLGKPVRTADKPVDTEQTKAGSTQEAIDNGHFENAGQLLTACQKEYGMNRSQVLVELNVSAPNEIKDLDKAWLAICKAAEAK